MSRDMQDNVGLFVPTTNIWDVQNLQEGKDISPALKELLILLYQDIGDISSALNLKTSGYLFQQEFINGKVLFNQKYIPNSYGRQVFQIIVDCGALPDTTTKAIPHNVVVLNSTQWTSITGAATDPVRMQGLPIPYASAATPDVIEVSVDATNVYITTSSDMTAFSQAYVILEYVKQ